MSSGAIALAFTAGMVAAFNPCGFSLLPAYIGAFVSGDEVERRMDQRVVRAIVVAGAVSVGFVLVFSVAGFVIDRVAGEAQRQLPWVTIAIGGLLVLTGIATAAGWKPTIALRGPAFSTTGGDIRVMVGYGITYAVASLSCTIGPFLAVTGVATLRSVAEGAAAYIAYALGMGVIILVLSVASAMAHTTVTTHMRRLSRLAPRVGGALMVAAGLYAIWYGRWELAVYRGDLGTDPVIETAEDLRLWVIRSIESIGSQRLALLALVLVTGLLVAARRRPPTETSSTRVGLPAHATEVDDPAPVGPRSR